MIDCSIKELVDIIRKFLFTFFKIYFFDKNEKVLLLLSTITK